MLQAACVAPWATVLGYELGGGAGAALRRSASGTELSPCSAVYSESGTVRGKPRAALEELSNESSSRRNSLDNTRWTQGM